MYYIVKLSDKNIDDDEYLQELSFFFDTYEEASSFISIAISNSGGDVRVKIETTDEQ